MADLIFRPTRTQLGRFLLATALVTAVAVVFIAIWVYDGNNVPDDVVSVAGGATVAALALLYCLARYRLALTACTPAGIRTRGLRNRSCPWADVRRIALRERAGPNASNYQVLVTTARGRRFALGVPVDGWLMPDPQFTTKLRQIQEYWQQARPSPAPADQQEAAAPAADPNG